MSDRWSRSSLRRSLALWHAGALALILAIYAAVVFGVVSRYQSNALDDRLRGDFQWAAEMSEQRPDGTLSWFESTGSGEDAESPWFEVWAADGVPIYQSAFAQRFAIPGSADLMKRRQATVVSSQTGVGRFRVLSGAATIGGRPVMILVARSEEPGRRELHGLVVVLALGFPLGVAIAGCGGYLLARRALRPLEHMADRARIITAERLAERLPVANPSDELGRMAVVFNDTLGRLESSFEQMRRFTADVSHELRTPLTAIRSVGEVGLRRTRDEAGYRRIIGSMLEEADRLTRLVERLLVWSRAESGQARLAIEPFDLGLLASDVVEDVRVLAEEKNQTVLVERSGPTECPGDRALVRQALLNLIDNAVKHTPPGGRISLCVRGAPNAVTLDVTDSGPGIPAELGARIFDRFYLHTSGQRGQRGAGLGLAIAKWAVDAHGGNLSVASSGSHGTTFRMILPVPAGSMRHRETGVSAAAQQGATALSIRIAASR